MAIHLISGVPGAGKTLRAVYQMVELLRTEDGADRPFFGNVNGLRGQAPIPDVWMDVPDGSLILIDEVQQRWRRYRAAGAPPPEIAALETHRHRGIDFILTCQNPSQLSTDVRALVDTHEHLMRKGKLAGAIVWRWEGVCHTSPVTHKSDADCEASVWRYPKWVFDQYESAVMHTGKRRLPRILVVAPVVFLGAAGAIAFAFAQVKSISPDGIDSSESIASSDAAIVQPGRVVQSSVPTETARAGAIYEGFCRLYTENGRRILVSDPDCRNAMQMGFPIEVEVLQL